MENMLSLIRVFDLDLVLRPWFNAHGVADVRRWGELDPAPDSYVIALLPVADIAECLPALADATLVVMPAFEPRSLDTIPRAAWIGMTDQSYAHVLAATNAFVHGWVCNPTRREAELDAFGMYDGAEWISTGQPRTILSDHMSTVEGCPGCGIPISGNQYAAICPGCGERVVLSAF